ncbi:N-6 DNA methylase [Salinigranum halophilum]|uniref:N-6 DNA methylase n=1 Tax=Salinigranum halophilum TaxID=2565931 RepID=UPI00191BCE2E|nr:N-6 DNA methylase [Salinigranum halophilum]
MALDPSERKRAARKRGLDWPTTTEARDRLRDRIFQAMRHGEDVVIDAPTALGKTYTVATEPWLNHSDVTDDSPVVHFSETREARDGAAASSRDATGVTAATLKGRKERCPVARGDHDPADLEDPDIFGRAYEYLIRQFADDAGKKGGEFYTPREVVQLLVECVDPEPGHRVYDPCCGSGGMLIYSAQHIRDEGGDTDDVSLYGQEKNLNTWAIGQMNVLLHEMQDAKIEKGDTITEPKLVTEHGELEVFDRVVANPPWNQKKWSKEWVQENEPYNRFPYGLSPSNRGDWTWIQLMLASLSETGKAGIVMDNGILFRSRSEKKIRKPILEADLIEAVIALPGNLFYNTSSPGCILIMNKDKPEERERKIQFIYAEEQTLRESGVQVYEELSNQNQLTQECVEYLAETHFTGREEAHHSRLVDIEEIKENDWNLNVPRYVDTTEPEEPIDVREKLRELDKLAEERRKTDEELQQYMKGLEYQ